MDKKRLIYHKEIIKQLYFENFLSCAGISDKIGKSLPLTMKLITELIDEGYVVETGLAISTGGRRPQMYSLRDGVLFSVAVAMDQYVTSIAIMDMDNKYIGEVEKFELHLSKSENVYSILAEKIAGIIERSGIEKRRIAGIGIGAPGLVNTLTGINSSFLNSPDNDSLVNYLSHHFALPVFIENDSTLIGLAELRFGSAYGKKNVMVINIGWGVGLSLILNNELFKGTNGYVGEFSHIPLFSNGKLCSCGKTGCLETEASLYVIIEKAIDGLKAGQVSVLDQAILEKEHVALSCDMIINAARRGDRFAIQLLFDAGYTIGRGLAILIHLLSPELIVLSGRGSLAGKIWEAPIQHALNEHCIPYLAANTEIKISSLGQEAELIGAASLVMENYTKEKQDNLIKGKLKVTSKR